MVKKIKKFPLAILYIGIIFIFLIISVSIIIFVKNKAEKTNKSFYSSQKETLKEQGLIDIVNTISKFEENLISNNYTYLNQMFDTDKINNYFSSNQPQYNYKVLDSNILNIATNNGWDVTLLLQIKIGDNPQKYLITRHVSYKSPEKLSYFGYETENTVSNNTNIDYLEGFALSKEELKGNIQKTN